MTPASTDNSIITRWRHAHQSWVRVAPQSDNTSVITGFHAAYAFLCGTSVDCWLCVFLYRCVFMFSR